MTATPGFGRAHGGAQAQLVGTTDTATAIAQATASAPWLACRRLRDDKVARLACFGGLARQVIAPGHGELLAVCNS